MSGIKVFLIATIGVCCLLQMTAGHSNKQRLLHDLLNDYEPVIDPGDIDLSTAFSLICSYKDTETGMVVSHGYQQYFWKDERLTWTPEDYGGLQSLRIPGDRLWIPDMRGFLTMTSEVEVDSDINAVVMSDGSVIWIPRVTYRSFCTAGSDNALTCLMRIGSWAYDGNNIKLKVTEGTDGLDLSTYSSSCPLKVDSHKSEVVAHTYPCCEEPYPSLDMSIVFKPQ